MRGYQLCGEKCCCCACNKEASRGVCEVNGISLTSMVSKVLCKSRLSCVVEEKGLIAEEQGGFQKGEDVL